MTVETQKVVERAEKLQVWVDQAVDVLKKAKPVVFAVDDTNQVYLKFFLSGRVNSEWHNKWFVYITKLAHFNLDDEHLLKTLATTQDWIKLEILKAITKEIWTIYLTYAAGS